jgi:ABC-type sugar transport system permease subunit
MYQNAFTYGKMGYAAALGLMMFLVILTLTFINLRIMRSDPQ